LTLEDETVFCLTVIDDGSGVDSFTVDFSAGARAADLT